MRNRTLSVSLLSAGLVLGGFLLPSARAHDEPKEQANPPREKTASDEGRQGFPMLDRLHTAVDELKLSDDQKGKVDKMFEDARSQLKKAREDANGDRQEIMTKSRAVFEKLREQVAGVLTDDQKEQLKPKIQNLFQRAGGDVVSRLKGALDKLDLTDDQKTKVHDLLESAEKKAKDLRAGAENGGPDAQKLRDLMQDTREKLMGILTEDQKQKLQQEFQQGDAGGARPQAGEKKSDQ